MRLRLLAPVLLLTLWPVHAADIGIASGDFIAPIRARSRKRYAQHIAVMTTRPTGTISLARAGERVRSAVIAQPAYGNGEKKPFVPESSHS